jgi:tRNA nucleotidyltransferase (CCA-adding enzyme)
MCYNPTDGYTDLYGGMSDLDARVIRAVGDAETRFDEDALRIFRAIRFASVLDFQIEKSTADAVHKKRELLVNVSRERIYTEWRKLLSGKAAHRVISEYSDVIAVAIPELSSLKLPDENKFIAADFTTRLLSLYKLSCTDPVSAFSASMRALKTDNAIRTFGESVLSMHGISLSSLAGALMTLKNYGVAASREYIKLGILLGELEASATIAVENAISSGIPYSTSMLAINGADLTAIGLSGPAVGRELSRLLDAVISGEIPNEREALVACARLHI